MDKTNSIVKFGDTELHVSINTDYELEIDWNELIKAIGFESKRGLEKIIENHPELKDKEFSYIKKVMNEEGGILKKREKRIFNEQGIYEVALLANTQRAKEFRRFVRNFMTKFRRNELTISSGNSADNVKRLEQLKEIIVKRDDELEKIIEFIDSAKEGFNRLDKLIQEMASIKETIEAFKAALNELSEDFYGVDEGGEE